MIDIRAWSPEPIRRRMRTGVTALDFLNLGDYRDLMLEIMGIKHDGGANTDLILQFSQDGISFDAVAANYVMFGEGAGVSGGALLNSALPPNVAVAGWIEILNFNTNYPTSVLFRGGRHASSSGVRSSPTFNTQLVPWSALRLTTAAGSNISMNLGVQLRARKP